MFKSLWSLFVSNLDHEVDPHCIGCGVDTFAIDEYYSVHDELWAQAIPDPNMQNESMLCIGCLEQRIGRHLTAADFSMAPINTFFTRSQRLLQRRTASK